MDDKRNSLLTIGLVCAVLLVLGVADLWNSDRVYSEAENRVLASRPAFSWESLFTGEYGDAYEKTGEPLGCQGDAGTDGGQHSHG